jgi:hypothetical protein
VKKLFLVFFVLMAGMAGLSAAPPRPGGADDAPQIPLTDSIVFIPASMRPGGIFVALGNDAAFTEAIGLICLWVDQYQAGQLTGDELKTLAAGRITVMYMRQQVNDGGMRPLAEKTRAKVDRFFLSQELKLGIRRVSSLDPAEFPLLC